ncbi:hypothetical protein [Desulfocurvibacter africanus]|uniref:Lipoprotein n=1 Tax=Desulfocurvibacter africanus subsp. africanus str. Walvis Bay TaxID=690850 RepID=F3YXE6_DESAF|nr:hypothetical protein [Desulfocurvibacter africanus]EGJ51723.1 hypothetical protein Desaf_3437 [Desulfocurvibacter africanus subsp. africanus str. Walvis Bay]
MRIRFALLAVVMTLTVSACAGMNNQGGTLVGEGSVVYPYEPGKGLKIDLAGYKFGNIDKYKYVGAVSYSWSHRDYSGVYYMKMFSFDEYLRANTMLASSPKSIDSRGDGMQVLATDTISFNNGEVVFKRCLVNSMNGQHAMVEYSTTNKFGQAIAVYFYFRFGDGSIDTIKEHAENVLKVSVIPMSP